MAGLSTDIPAFYNDICDVMRIFLTGDIRLTDSPDSGEPFLRHFCRIDESGTASAAAYYPNGLAGERFEYEYVTGRLPKDALSRKKFLKRAVKISVFRAMKPYFADVRTPWGSLTGIRPAKLFYEMTKETGSEEAALRYFTERFDVEPEKAKLAAEVAANQRHIADSAEKGDMGIYVGIPFCTTRCLYCSFASNAADKCASLVEPYLSALEHEISKCAEILASGRVRSMYVGGGTPTALNAAQLARVLAAVRKHIGGGCEFTVEAGRPDTIDAEKLSVMREYGVNRISINPQTMNDETLEIIGRRHTAQQTVEAFYLARRAGFDNINMDTIIALPGEIAKTAEETFSRIAELRPESLTVHTLAIKRASRLHENADKYLLPDANEVYGMLEVSRQWAERMGMRPYYMYRQKHMAGSLENVGYCLPGRECVYNIDNMEETASIVAFGAGAITKRVYGEKGRIERAPNPRDIRRYIENTDNYIKRKKTLFELTGRY